KALATQFSVSVVVSITLGCVGFTLLGYFTAHPELLPSNIDLKENADQVFPHFIAFRLPAGISGLVVAAMFAAAMSSIDSGVNSITAVVTTDVMDRLGHAPKTEREHIHKARWLALGIGAFVVATSSFMGLIPGNITEVTGKTSNLLTTPIFCLFFFALFVPFASPRGVFMGAFFGILAAAIVAFCGPLVLALYLHFDVDPATFGSTLVETVVESVDDRTGLVTGVTKLSCPDPISFQWIGPIAVLVNVTVGCLASLLLPGRRQPAGEGL
ncbi:MAG: hypothetical protein VB858_00230, partial [Planctomycetaceae bacterium]